MNMLIVFAAKHLFLISIIVAGWYFFTLPNTLKKKFSALTLASFALAFVVAKLLGAIFNDPRPFVSNHVIPLIAHSADNGFPSDHTLLTMAIASVVFVYNRKLGIVLGIISFIVGFSRVLAGVHHQIDIIGAMGIAIVSVAGIVIGTKRAKAYKIVRLINTKEKLKPRSK